MELINNIQSDMLAYLGRFGFLAVSQFHLLTGKSVGYIREMLGSLARRKYINSYRVEISYKVRAENIYFLLPLGQEFLVSHKNVFVDEIKLPVAKNPVVTKDYFHRFAFITVHIYLYKYLLAQNIPLVSFASYFDKTGSIKAGNLIAKTTIPLGKEGMLIPDGVMIASNRMFLIEMYCDKDTKRIINQLALHARAITIGAPAKALGIPDNPFVLSVFAHAGIKAAVIKRLTNNERFAAVSHLYFFATLDEVKTNVGTAFTTIHNQPLMIT